MTEASALLAEDAPWNLTTTNTTSHTGNLLVEIMGVWITGACCILGLVGSALTCIVLAQAFRRSPMFYVLRAAAATDLVFLFSVLLIQTAVNVYELSGGLYTFYRHRYAIQMAVWPILMTAQMATVWLTVLVSAERYIAICYPLRAASICTLKRVRRAVIIVVIISAIYNVPRYLEFHVQTTEDGLRFLDKTDLAKTPLYRYLYSCVLYALFLFLLPLGLLVFLNASLVAALRRGRRRWHSMQARQRREQNLTVIPLAVVLVFFICAMPALGVNVMDAIDMRILQSSSGVLFLLFANLLVVLNSTSNFVIYCLLGRKFRQRLRRLFSSECCRKRAKQYSRNDVLSLSQYSQSKASKIW